MQPAGACGWIASALTVQHMGAGGDDFPAGEACTGFQDGRTSDYDARISDYGKAASCGSCTVVAIQLPGRAAGCVGCNHC